jgi:hypothetical protein
MGRPDTFKVAIQEEGCRRCHQPLCMGASTDVLLLGQTCQGHTQVNRAAQRSAGGTERLLSHRIRRC